MRKYIWDADGDWRSNISASDAVKCEEEKNICNRGTCIALHFSFGKSHGRKKVKSSGKRDSSIYHSTLLLLILPLSFSLKSLLTSREVCSSRLDSS